ncbi:MAG TPA: hypothetical protein VFW60_01925 [Rhodanobacteraceae bacterium]|nr:hypothetical protein [Rhodanobacteraceae bacterium]
MTRMRPKIHGPGLIIAMAWVAALTGCASAPPPIQMMDRAQTEIRAARNAGAATAAPEALAEAERRLAAAQQFTSTNDNDKAADKAAEAEAAAETAGARAEAARLDGEISQQTQVNAGLTADLQRRQAAAAAAQQAAAKLPPAPAPSSSAGNAPAVMLPSIQLGRPAPASTAGNPAPSSTAGPPASGMNP